MYTRLKMKKKYIKTARVLIALLLWMPFVMHAQTWPGSLQGRWTFDNASNPVEATLGNDLLLTGSILPIPGPVANDQAVRIGPGSYFHCYHDIPANGAGAPGFVNKYAILIDFRIPQLGQWYTFFQTNIQNANDGEAFISPAGKIGVSQTGYSSYTVIPGQWYRLVVTADLGNHYDYYLDGQVLQQGGAQDLDGRFALYPLLNGNDLLFFADDNGEDNNIDIAQIAVFDTTLTTQEINDLGGFGHNINGYAAIKPYLECPTSTSIYINWHNADSSITKVEYGTDSLSLGSLAMGTNINNGGRRWHTVKLVGLLPNTAYYYRCIAGTDTSMVFPFRSALSPATPGGHIRFGIISDSQTDISQSSFTASAMREKFIELYGPDWQNAVSLVMHTGDIMGNGNEIAAYESEYFTPFSQLSCSVPFMISIGNHESESSYFYKYFHYDEFSPYQYPNALCERYYSFSLGNVQFLSTNGAGNYDNAAQASWIQQSLQTFDANQDVDFVFSFGHRPGRSEVWPDGNSSYVYNTLFPLLSAHPKVAMHAGGHSHNLELGAHLSVNAEKRDFRTLVNGGAGGALDRWGMYPNQTDYPDVQQAYDYHGYVIVDVDMDNQSYVAKLYSLGNPDRPMYNAELTSWHGVLNRAAPATPVTVSPASACTSSTPTLLASAFVGSDSLMSSAFQITATPGDFSACVLDTIRDCTNVYGDSGSPDYLPVNKNATVNLSELTVPAGILQIGSSYEWRVRYRDHNLRWSEWSAPAPVIVLGAAVVSGQITYSNLQATALPGVIVSLIDNSGLCIATDTTNSTGHYSFDIMNPGQYSLTATSTALPGGFSSADALAVMKHFVQLSPLSGLYLKAASVRVNNLVNSLDALFVQRRFLQMITTFPKGDWVFEQKQLSVTAIQCYQLNLKGICYGDVNGSFIP